MPEISIIVPSLNVAPYIQECLNSLKKQTFKDIEVLCIDAGSTDGTLEIIKKNAAEDSQIKLLKSDRKSYGYQVNLGLDYACGKYIGIVDSDDYVDTDMYAYLFSVMESGDYDFAKCNYFVEMRYKKGSTTEHLSFLKNLSLQNQISLINNAVSIYDHPEVILAETYIWNGLYRKNFLDDNHIRVNETKGAAWQDIGFSISMLLSAKKIFIADKYFNYYRVGRAGNSTDNPNMLNFVYQEWKRVFDQYNIPDDKQIKRYIYARMAWQFAGVYSDALKLQDYNTDSEYLASYPWFRDMLQNAMQDYNLCIIGEEFYERLGLIFEKPKIFARLRKNIDEYKTESMQSMLKLIKEKNIVIFGSGIYGKNALQRLDPLDYNIDAFADNSEAKWGTAYAGVNIMNPEECVRMYSDDSYLIANKLHYQEITEQLLKLGIDKDHISYWSV